MTLKSQDSGRAAAADTTPPPPHKSERRNVSFMALCYLAWPGWLTGSLGHYYHDPR